MTAHAGGVQATLRYHPYNRYDVFDVADRLTIVRHGKTLVARKPKPRACHPYTCFPNIKYGVRAVVVRDLDGDGEPEVVYSSFWGGAHCCFIAQVYRFDPKRDRYRTVSRNFADLGYRLRDLEHDGRVEWLSVDKRFAYAFTSFAGSGFPAQIWHFRHGRFVDVTRRYRARVRRDARRHWRAYVRVRHRRDGEQRGQIAAWAADEYLLGRRAHARRVLRREA